MIPEMRSARISFILLSFLLSASIASAGIFSRKKPTQLAVRTTAYTHSESDHIKYGRKTAAGGTLKYGKKYSSAAADWSKFPLGTKFKIDGMDTTFVVDDYGRALVGTETIDIYKPSRSAMNQWGVKHVDIKILEYGDFEKSRDILKDRTKYAHVRQMLAGIDRNPGPEPQKRPGGSLFKKTASKPGPPKTSRPPKLQLASATSKSRPAPTPKSAPESSPAPAKAPEPARPTIPSPPVPTTETPTLAAATTSKPASEPEATDSTTTAAMATTPAPRPTLPAPALRKVKPLKVASLGHPESSEPDVRESPAETSPAATPPNRLRKRDFRPLTLSFNG